MGGRQEKRKQGKQGRDENMLSHMVKLKRFPVIINSDISKYCLLQYLFHNCGL